MTCKRNKIKEFAILIFITIFIVGNPTSIYAGESKLDGHIINVTSRKITLESGEILKVSPQVTLTNRRGKKRRFNSDIINSWERLRVTIRPIKGEMVVMEIKELVKSE